METMPGSSERSEGAVGGIVRLVESFGAVRRVTTSEVVWAFAGGIDRREESKKRAPQNGGLLLQSGRAIFRSDTPDRFRQYD